MSVQKIYRAFCAGSAFLFWGSRPFTALAADEITLKGALEKAKSTISDSVSEVKDIALLIIFIIGIVLVVWGYAARNKSNGDNDKMINAGIYAIVAVALVEIFSTLAGV